MDLSPICKRGLHRQPGRRLSRRRRSFRRRHAVQHRQWSDAYTEWETFQLRTGTPMNGNTAGRRELTATRSRSSVGGARYAAITKFQCVVDVRARRNRSCANMTQRQ